MLLKNSLKPLNFSKGVSVAFRIRDIGSLMLIRDVQAFKSFTATHGSSLRVRQVKVKEEEEVELL